MNLRIGRVGTTLVELLMAITLFLIVLGAVLHVTSMIRSMTSRGTISLQNLQEARLAISALRRDFLTACPVFSEKDTPRARELLRRDPVRPGATAPVTGQSIPILVSDRELAFHRFVFDPSAGAGPPAIEPVRYTYEPVAERMIRITPRLTTVFRGIRAVSFLVYAQQANPEVPLLWVNLEVRQELAGVATGPTLALSTTVHSAMTADLKNHPEWYLLTARQP